MKRQKGFSLLEAVVAITVLAVSGGALFAWVNTSLLSTIRMEERSKERYLVEQSLALLEIINPMDQPEGSRPLAQYELTWQATEVEPPKAGVNRYGIEGLYQVALYDLQVVVRSDDHEVAAFDVKQVGYRRVPQN